MVNIEQCCGGRLDVDGQSNSVWHCKISLSLGVFARMRASWSLSFYVPTVSTVKWRWNTEFWQEAGLTCTIVASKFSVSHCAMLTLTHSMILSILDFCFLIDGESMHFKEFNNFIFWTVYMWQKFKLSIEKYKSF